MVKKIKLDNEENISSVQPMKENKLLIFTPETIIIYDQDTDQKTIKENPFKIGFKYKVCQSDKFIYQLDLDCKDESQKNF